MQTFKKNVKKKMFKCQKNIKVLYKQCFYSACIKWYVQSNTKLT